MSPPSHEPTEDLQWVKAAATEEKRALDEIRQSLWSEHTHLFRWLTASLLAINGGSAIALLSSEFLSSSTKLLSGGLFCGGVFSALLIGVFGQRATQKALPKVQKLAGYWLSVSIDGEREEELEQELINDLNRVGPSGYASRAVGWISAILFALGVAAIGFEIYHKGDEHGEGTGQHRFNRE